MNMRADDDGFVNNPRKVQREIGVSDDDFRVLLAKRFIIGFDNGLIVIKHWRMHNYLRKDRYHPTQYQDEAATLYIKENGAYTQSPHTGCRTVAGRLPDGIPAVDGRSTENREDENRIEESSQEEPSRGGAVPISELRERLKGERNGH